MAASEQQRPSRKPKGRPVGVAPPTALSSGLGKCQPTLILNLTRGFTETLEDVLRHDLVFAESSRWCRSCHDLPVEVKLNIAQYADGPTLFEMTKALGGSVLVMGGSSAARFMDGILPRAQEKLETMRKRRYQAIIVDDESIQEEEIMAFLYDQYQRFSVSIVVVASFSHCGPQALRERFGVEWDTMMDFNYKYRLTDHGRRILTSDAFPYKEIRAKSLLVHGWKAGENLFSTYYYVDPHRIIGESRNGNPIEGSSPVVAKISGDKAISYFGFRNSANIVSYGAIILRLCYAACHAIPEVASRFRAIRVAPPVTVAAKKSSAPQQKIPPEADWPAVDNRSGVDNDFHSRSRQIVRGSQSSRAAKKDSKNRRATTRSRTKAGAKAGTKAGAKTVPPPKNLDPVLTTSQMLLLLAAVAILIAIYFVPDDARDLK